MFAIWSEFDNNNHTTFFIRFQNETIGFECWFDFVEELNYIHEHEEWMD